MRIPVIKTRSGDRDEKIQPSANVTKHRAIVNDPHCHAACRRYFAGFWCCFQDPNIVASLPFLGTDGLVHVLKLMAEAGSAIFANLPLLFAVGVAVGLSDDQGIAGLSAIAGF